MPLVSSSIEQGIRSSAIVGTYTDTIRPVGDTTTIRTDVHLSVSALGVVLHREDAERIERWRGGLLREFHGITTVNGSAAAATALINIDGSDIWTQKCLIDGSLRYKVWIDRDNTPVAFAVDDKSGKVFFYLER